MKDGDGLGADARGRREGDVGTYQQLHIPLGFDPPRDETRGFKLTLEVLHLPQHARDSSRPH